MREKLAAALTSAAALSKKAAALAAPTEPATAPAIPDQAPTAAPSPPAAALAPPEPPDERAARLVRHANTWLTAALAAVGAAVLGAGITFSNVGQLEWGTDTFRLLIAGISAAVGVAGLADVLACLVRLQHPAKGSLAYLRKTKEGWLHHLIENDRHLIGGFDDVDALLKRYDTLHQRIWAAEAHQRMFTEMLEDPQKRATTPPTTVAEANLALDRATAALAAERARTSKELERLQGVVDTLVKWAGVDSLITDSHKWTEQAIQSALIATLGIVIFAWAGNPPERPDAGDTLSSRPVTMLTTEPPGLDDSSAAPNQEGRQM